MLGTRPPVIEPDRFVNCRIVRQTLSSGSDARPGRARRLLRCGRGVGTTRWSGVCSPTPGPSSSCRAGSSENERALADADVVLRGERRFDAALIARLTRCVGLVTYSVGLDGIDLDVAAAAGIAVRNVPDYCTAEVADHAALLVLASIRRLPHWLDTTARGGWLQPEDQRTIRRTAGSPSASSVPAGSVAPSPGGSARSARRRSPSIRSSRGATPNCRSSPRTSCSPVRTRSSCVRRRRPAARRCSTRRRSPRSVVRSR